MLELKGLASAELAVSYEEKHYVSFLFAAYHEYQIDIFRSLQNYPLFFLQGPQGDDVIPVGRSLLILHCFGGRVHLLLQELLQPAVFPFEKINCRVDLIHIAFPVDFAGADSFALADVVVEARSVAFGESDRAAPLQPVNAVEYVHCLVDRSRVAVGPEISAVIPDDIPGLDDPGILLPGGDFYIRVCLVVPEQDVVFGLVLFDQVALQYERFHLRPGGDVFELFDVGDHGPDLGRHVFRRLEILAHPVLQ